MIRQTLMILTATFTFSSFTFASGISQSDKDAIAERIKPVGDVYLTGSAPVAAKPSGPRDGATVYGTYCVACHGTGISGAPKKGNATDWAPHLAKGMETLTNHAINGFNAMPPKGTCMDCSDDELVAAIKHMTESL